MSISRRTWKDRHGKEHSVLQVSVIVGKKVDGKPDRRRLTVPGGAKASRQDARNFEQEIIVEAKLHPRPSSPIPTANDFWAEFMRISAASNSPGEMENKRKAGKHFLAQYGTRRLDQVGSHELEVFVVTLAEEKLAAKTRRNYLGVVKRMLKMAKRAGHIVAVPDTEPIHVPRTKGRALTVEETQRLLDACADRDVQRMILVAQHVGLRIGEILGLKWSDIDLQTGTLTLRRDDGAVRRVPTGNMEPGQPRWRWELAPLKEAKFFHADPVLPLDPEIVAALRTWPKRGKFVFTTEGRFITYNEVTPALVAAFKKAGLPALKWHSLRRSFATQNANSGMPTPVISQLLTHKSTTMTDRYINVQDDEVRRWVNRKAGTVLSLVGGQREGAA